MNKKEKVEKYDNLGIRTLLRISTKYMWNIFGLISLILIQRNYGYETVGVMAFGMAYVSLFLPFSDLGFSSAHSKRFNERELDGAICNGTYATVRILLNFLMLAIVILTITIQKYLGYSFESRTVEIVIYLYIIRYFFYNINKTFHGIFNAKLEVAKKVIPNTITRFIQMLIKCTIAIFFYKEFGVEYLVGAEIISAFILTLIFLYVIKNTKFKKPNWDYFKSYTTFAIPVIFIGIVTSLNHSFDKIILQYFIGSESVGIYVIAERMAFFFLVISASITKLLFPSFSNLHSNKKLKKISVLSNKSVRYISMTFIPLVLFIYIFSEEILVFLFGPDSHKSAASLKVLLLAAYFLAISRPYSIQITSTGHVKVGLMITTIALIINIILNLIFIPEYFLGFKLMGLGIIGAAYSFFASIFFMAIMGKYYAYQYTKTKLYYNLWKHILSSSITFLILINLKAIHYDIYLLPIYFTLIVLLFFGMMYVIREFDNKDIRFYFNLINPHKIKNYISNEIKS